MAPTAGFMEGGPSIIDKIGRPSAGPAKPQPAAAHARPSPPAAPRPVTADAPPPGRTTFHRTPGRGVGASRVEYSCSPSFRHERSPAPARLPRPGEGRPAPGPARKPERVYGQPGDRANWAEHLVLTHRPQSWNQGRQPLPTLEGSASLGGTISVGSPGVHHIALERPPWNGRLEGMESPVSTPRPLDPKPRGGHGTSVVPGGPPLAAPYEAPRPHTSGGLSRGSTLASRGSVTDRPSTRGGSVFGESTLGGASAATAGSALHVWPQYPLEGEHSSRKEHAQRYNVDTWRVDLNHKRWCSKVERRKPQPFSSLALNRALYSRLPREVAPKNLPDYQSSVSVVTGAAVAKEMQWIQDRHVRMRQIIKDQHVRKSTSKQYEKALRMWFAAVTIQRWCRNWLKSRFPNRTQYREPLEKTRRRLKKFSESNLEMPEDRTQRAYPKPWLIPEIRRKLELKARSKKALLDAKAAEAKAAAGA